MAVTEFAAMGQGEGLGAALAEAGFMAALERNCHKVGGWLREGEDSTARHGMARQQPPIHQPQQQRQQQQLSSSSSSKGVQE